MFCSRAVSASRSHQFQGYKPHQYPNSSCTQSLKSVSCGVELSPHRDPTNFTDTNRINIPMPDDCISACAFAQEVVHAIVEIHVLAESNRLRIEPSVSGVQTASISQVPGRVQQKMFTESVATMIATFLPGSPGRSICPKIAVKLTTLDVVPYAFVCFLLFLLSPFLSNLHLSLVPPSLFKTKIFVRSPSND